MKKEYKIGIAIVGLLALYFGFLAFRVGPLNVGSAPNGLAATVATSSQNVVTNATMQLTATSTCAARIITTGAVAIGLNFTKNFDGSNMGLYQAASTTVAYDASIYGCGTLKVRSSGASTNVNFVELN